ncbi:hypothetical protein BGW80DRAFT_1317829, partial [Lactifluus volemus]
MGEGVGVGGGTLAWRVGRQGQKRWEAGGERKMGRRSLRNVGGSVRGIAEDVATGSSCSAIAIASLRRVNTRN